MICRALQRSVPLAVPALHATGYARDSVPERFRRRTPVAINESLVILRFARENVVLQFTRCVVCPTVYTT